MAGQQHESYSIPMFFSSMGITEKNIIAADRTTAAGIRTAGNRTTADMTTAADKAAANRALVNRAENAGSMPFKPMGEMAENAHTPEVASQKKCRSSQWVVRSNK